MIEFFISYSYGVRSWDVAFCDNIKDMVRPLRIEYPCAFYHITSRGNKKENIFTSDKDRELFLNILSWVIKTHHWICHAYCLMDNHYHLLIETPDGNLSVGMRDLNGLFTQKYNQTHKTVGHILQGRYKAFIIEKETYLLEVARYIVLNPVRAGMFKHPCDWVWSSYLATSGAKSPPDWLSTHDLLNLFSVNLSDAHTHYQTFVEEGIRHHSPFQDAQHGIILGSPQFVMEMWDRKPDSSKILEVSKKERMIGCPKLNSLFDNPQTTEDRNHAIEFARMYCGYSITEIANYLKIHRSTISKILHQNDKKRHPTT